MGNLTRLIHTLTICVTIHNVGDKPTVTLHTTFIAIVVSHIRRIGRQPGQTTLHSGQSRSSWSAEQGNNKVSTKSGLNTVCRLNPLVIFPVKVRNSFNTGVLFCTVEKCTLHTKWWRNICAYLICLNTQLCEVCCSFQYCRWFPMFSWLM